MRIVSLVVVLGIIYFAYTKRVETKRDTVGEAMTEYDRTAPAPASQSSSPASASAAQPSSSGIKRPIDRTRAVLQQVKQRASEEP